MPGLLCFKVNYFNNNQNISIDNLFGFFYCNIIAPDENYLGLLPVRNSLGIEFPLGVWSGWYFSKELKFAKENGYKFEVLNGYHFNSEPNVFKSYIENIYSIKSNSINPTQKSISKSLLNNLLGRFGINLDKPVTEHIIKKGIFISGKTYGFIDINDNFINKTKGIKSSSLTYSD